MLAGTGGVTKTTSATVTLTGSNSYTGSTSLNAGVLIAGSAGALANGTISFAGGTLRYASGNTADLSSKFSNATNQKYLIDTGSQTIFFNTALTSSGGSFTKSGPGTIIFEVPNTFTGATTINDGVLRFGVDNAIGAGSLLLNNATAFLDLNGNSNTVGTVTLNGGTITGGTLTSIASFQLLNGTVAAVLAGSGIPVVKSQHRYGHPLGKQHVYRRDHSHYCYGRSGSRQSQCGLDLPGRWHFSSGGTLR